MNRKSPFFFGLHVNQGYTAPTCCHTTSVDRWHYPSAPNKVVDLFIRYLVTKNFSLQGNVNNLFDKTYDTNVEGSINYGAPRNFSIIGTD